MVKKNIFHCKGGLKQAIPESVTFGEEEIRIILPSCDVRKWPDKCQVCSKREKFETAYHPISFRKFCYPPCCVWKQIPISENSQEVTNHG